VFIFNSGFVASRKQYAVRASPFRTSPVRFHFLFFFFPREVFSDSRAARSFEFCDAFGLGRSLAVSPPSVNCHAFNDDCVAPRNNMAKPICSLTSARRVLNIPGRVLCFCGHKTTATKTFLDCRWVVGTAGQTAVTGTAIGPRATCSFVICTRNGTNVKKVRTCIRLSWTDASRYWSLYGFPTIRVMNEQTLPVRTTGCTPSGGFILIRCVISSRVSIRSTRHCGVAVNRKNIGRF